MFGCWDKSITDHINFMTKPFINIYNTSSRLRRASIKSAISVKAPPLPAPQIIQHVKSSFSPCHFLQKVRQTTTTLVINRQKVLKSVWFEHIISITSCWTANADYGMKISLHRLLLHESNWFVLTTLPL